MTRVCIDDEFHAELQGEYRSMEAAVAELKRRAALPWNQPPNRAPCKFWWTCCRRYQIVEFDDTRYPWKELRRTAVVEISAAGVTWFR